MSNVWPLLNYTYITTKQEQERSWCWVLMLCGAGSMTGAVQASEQFGVGFGVGGRLVRSSVLEELGSFFLTCEKKSTKQLQPIIINSKWTKLPNHRTLVFLFYYYHLLSRKMHCRIKLSLSINPRIWYLIWAQKVGARYCLRLINCSRLRPLDLPLLRCRALAGTWGRQAEELWRLWHYESPASRRS